ncbi:MAG TPA: lipid IV(A) 3-deoxy-D-manno-octulosonic acid transferase [Casimicrobiaceae bacterium]|jgi:3-deoxy-D-manno-octulosonic-acid transferase|nr:lipid IV(A) 3-deoxy-D-manno-octulosonic acid transferase [Casimicrobiaceae bacterium]
MEPARALYTLLGFAVLPLLPLRLWWRGRREPGYRRWVGERFGRYSATVSAPTFWIHAVSVGETRAAAPLVQRLKTAYPDATLLLTHMTAAGRETGHALFGDAVVQAWLPYDVPFAVRSFYAHYRPTAGFLLETELWPNLIASAQATGIPLYLLNARLSERSARGYHRARALTRPMLQRLAGVAAQSDADAARLAALGAPNPIVTGNLKFDVSIPSTARELGAGFRVRFGTPRPVWLAASTRDGEEALLLDAVARRPMPGNPLLVLVPRHPQRFGVVAELLRARGIPFVRRSDEAAVPADIGVVLGDSMGEMAAYCAASDVAFIGGSLLPFGGHNLIEALAVGTPVVVGPHTFNFADATTGAIAAGAALRVADAAGLIAALAALLDDPARRREMGEAALRFHALHRGAADRLWAWLTPRLPAAGR